MQAQTHRGQAVTQLPNFQIIQGMSSEKFCLRWNDFESNVSSAFKDIRDEKEFFDITIAAGTQRIIIYLVRPRIGENNYV